MDNSLVIDEINKWKQIITSYEEIAVTSESDNSTTEGYIKEIIVIAFFKIYVKFEVFITDLFVHYSLGGNSSIGYSPERKLQFNTREQLESILKGKSSFIDYIEKMDNISKHIFLDNKNPFDILRDIAEYKTAMDQMKYIRNYIAHESDESKTRYMRYVLCNPQFISIQEFLLKKRGRTRYTNYSYYTDKIKEMSELLLNPPE